VVRFCITCMAWWSCFSCTHTHTHTSGHWSGGGCGSGCGCKIVGLLCFFVSRSSSRTNAKKMQKHLSQSPKKTHLISPSDKERLSFFFSSMRHHVLMMQQRYGQPSPQHQRKPSEKLLIAWPQHDTVIPRDDGLDDVSIRPSTRQGT